MAIKNLELPIFHYDNPTTGLPLSGGKVYVYAAGTTTSITTWQDSSQGVANSNPVVLDSYGNAKIWFDQSAKIIVKNSTDTVTYFTFDNVSPVGGTSVITGEYNLCQNGSFEAANTDSTPAQWTQSLLDPSATIQVSTADVTHGKQSCLFTGITGAGCGSITSQQFDVTADSMMALSFDMKASIATTESDVQIYWYQKDGTTAATPASTTVALPADGSSPIVWTTYSFLYSVPSDATRAEIKITGIGAGSTTKDGTVYFDNVLAYDNQSVAIGYTASPVTYLKTSAGATGTNPSIASEGEANTGMILKDSNGNEMLIAESVASAVNEITVTNAASGNKPSIDQTGTDNLGIDVEGVGLHNGRITDTYGMVNGIAVGTTTISSVANNTTGTNTVSHGFGDVPVDCGATVSWVNGTGVIACTMIASWSTVDHMQTVYNWPTVSSASIGLPSTADGSLGFAVRNEGGATDTFTINWWARPRQ